MWLRNNTEEISVDEIAQIVGGELIGNGSEKIVGVCSFTAPIANCITYVKDTNLLFKNELSELSAILIPDSLELPEVGQKPTFIKVVDPADKFIDVVRLFFDYVKPTAGISELASISTTARLGNNLHIGAFCSIADNVIIGDNCVLHPHVVIYPNVKLGDNAVIHSGACIRENTVIGDNVVIQNGTTVGSDGFGYVQNPKHGLRLVPQLGRVSLGDDVEIGANASVDRGTLQDTSLSKGVKLDNLVQVGHNVQIGAYSILCGMSAVAGSAKIGSGVVLGGQAGVADHLTIADGIRMAAKSGAAGSLTEKGDYAGFPAIKISTWRKQLVALKKLPMIIKKLKLLTD